MRPARAPGYRSGGSRKPSGYMFKMGPRSLLRDSSTQQRITTTMTATNSGVLAPIMIAAGTSGNCYFKINSVNSYSLRMRTTMEGCYLDYTNIGSGADLQLDMPFTQSSLYEDLYDFYRIDRVEVQMFVGSAWNGSTPGTEAGADVAAAAQPIIVFAVDNNDSRSTPSDVLIGYGNVEMKQVTLGDPLQLAYRPAATADLGNAVGAAGTGPVFSPTIGTTTPGVSHFGLKMAPLGFSAAVGNNGETIIGMVTFVVKQHMTFIAKRSL